MGIQHFSRYLFEATPAKLARPGFCVTYLALSFISIIS
jgi:hypothetical protein